jgi:phosphoribosylanthranilate isomerase
MLRKPYVGITGPVTSAEVSAIVSEFERAGYSMSSSHLPMIGFLVSLKTLNGQLVSNRRYPEFSGLRKLLEVSNGRVFPMIHYDSKEPNLSQQLEKIFDGIYQDGLCKAVQLNIVYPDKHQLAEAKRKMPELQIVFQASHQVLDGKDPREIARRISAYGSMIDYVLIDPSGGRGKEFNLEHSVNVYQELRNQTPNLTIGFAGGFTGSNVYERVNELIMHTKDHSFCIDAEGGLRDKLTDNYGDDLLNINKVSQYLQEAHKVLP